MISQRRKKNQSGQELIEFALVALLLITLLIGSFVGGMNLIRSIEANQTCRDLTDMYIHGADFSTYSMQQLAQRLATGLNLQIGGGFAGNSAANTGNSGNTLATVSEIMYVGSTTSPDCVAVGANNCTNHDSFVFLQQLQFGNGTLNTQSPSSLGNPSTAAISGSGVLASPITDSGAKLPNPGQSNMQNLWQSGANGTAPLQDGQVSYVVELFAQSPDLNLGSFLGSGVYARYFF
jgi:Flp pilus assembly protein TadG